MRARLIGAAVAGVCAAGPACGQGQGVAMPLQRDLFPPMGVSIPLYESDVLVENSLGERGLSGPVHAVSLWWTVRPDEEGSADEGELWSFEYDRQGMLVVTKCTNAQFVNMWMNLDPERRSQGDRTVNRTAGSLGGDWYERDEKIAVDYVLDSDGRPVAKRSYRNGELIHSVFFEPGGKNGNDTIRIHGEGNRPSMKCVVDESGRVTVVEGFDEGSVWVFDWIAEDLVALNDSVTGELVVEMKLDEHGDAVELWGPAAAIELSLEPIDDEEEKRRHSRRTYERDEHGNWTSMLIEYEREEGWEKMVLFEREITYWGD